MNFAFISKLNRTAKFWIGLLGILILGTASAVLPWLAKIYLFEKNSRFVLQELLIDSAAGYWNCSNELERIAKSDLLCSRLGLEYGTTNLFTIDLKKLRQQIIYNLPEVEKVSVRRILPDQLLVSITERIPRAELGKNRLIDEYGVILDRAYCADFSEDLPKLSFSQPLKNLKPGTVVENPTVSLVLEFIKMVSIDYPIIQLKKIFVANNDYIQCELIYKHDSASPFMIVLDANTSIQKLYDEIPERLIPALEHGLRDPSVSRRLRLNFEGMIVVDPVPR